MPVLLEEYQPNQQGTFRIDKEFTIQITSDQARLQVKGWLLDEVSYMMGVEQPTLIVNAHLTWRVPVIFTASTHGKVDNVGYVDVNAETGEMDSSMEKAEAICAAADQLADQLPPFKLFSVDDIPPECMPDKESTIPVLYWPDDSNQPFTQDHQPYYSQ